MKAVLISDLHLSAEQPALFELFKKFLHQLSADVVQLYILGDLFEAWIGDDDDSDLAKQVIRLLRNTHDRGIDLFVQRGNRDFLMRRRFAQLTGAQILSDHHIFDSFGQHALLMHGDLLCTDDIDYQRFRKRMHNPLYNFFLRNLPLKKRQKIAADWRRRSTMEKQNKKESIMDVNEQAVFEAFRLYKTNTLIHGHTHRPAVHNYEFNNETRKRLVLGDWGEKIWWIVASAQGFELKSQTANEVVKPHGVQDEIHQ